MNKDILVGIQVNVPEARRILRLLREHTAEEDLILQIETAIDDALLEEEEREEE